MEPMNERYSAVQKSPERTMHTRMAQALENLISIGQRLEIMADRVSGGMPESPSKGGSDIATAETMVWNMTQIEQATSRIMSEVNRLEQHI